MTGQTGPISGGSREAPRRADLPPTKDGSPLILLNPSEAAIDWALLHQPYELSPRWGATLERTQAVNGAITTAVVGHAPFGGHLVFSELSVEHVVPARIIPEEEIKTALGKRMPDRIVFPDSQIASRNGDVYIEFVEQWFPILWKEGYKIRNARLINLFDNRSRDIYDDNVLILSGVDITKEAITMYPLDDKKETDKFHFLLDGDKAREWFANLQKIEALARQ